MSAVAPELSRPFALAELGSEAVARTVTASAEECAALARRFGIVAVETLAAEIEIRRRRKGAVVVRGRVRAQVVQTCVVSLEPFAAPVEGEVEITYAPATAATSDLVVGIEEDTPEPLEGEAIDLGEIVAEHFGLALDPYPRRPGARLAVTAVGAEAESPSSPFAVLAALSRRRP